MEIVGFHEKLPTSAAESENHLNCQVDIEGVTRVLIIRDEIIQSSSHPNSLQNNLQSVSELIKEEEFRSYQFQNILQCIEADKLIDEKSEHSIRESSPRVSRLNKSRDKENKTVTFGLPPSPQRPQLDSEESSQDLFSEKDYSVFVERQITTIASNYPEDCTIIKCNQLLVQIIEAAGLKQIGLSGLANPHCEISFKNLVKTKDHLNKQRSLTYFVEKTICPKWQHQYFIFKVNCYSFFNVSLLNN